RLASVAPERSDLESVLGPRLQILERDRRAPGFFADRGHSGRGYRAVQADAIRATDWTLGRSKIKTTGRPPVVFILFCLALKLQRRDVLEIPSDTVDRRARVALLLDVEMLLID